MIINAATGGALMGKERDEAYDLLEEMASNSYQWKSERVDAKKSCGCIRTRCNIDNSCTT